MMNTKSPYVQPRLRTLGAVADLTKTGLTHGGSDAKSGSVSSNGV
jgi:hypothetical protein